MSGNLAGLALTYLAVCAITAFVCTAVKEDEDQHLVQGALRLFGVMTGGIAAFAALVQAVTFLADH
ncbi:MAG: hypothetical protein KF878_23285 [Planctomycetes bacterium]|nr:hypothetical protein [Planctomycetota bacterium]